jgi:hypothetical protein
MKRRDFIKAGSTAVWPRVVHAQQPAMPVIGFLSGVSPSGAYAGALAGFHRGLAENCFTEGVNVAVEYRWAEGHYERLAGMADDLVRRNVSVIFANASNLGIQAAKAATTTIPIVFTTATDRLLANAKAIASATGARVMAQTFNDRVERGRGRAAIARMPYSVDQAIAVLAGTRNLVLTGAAIPAAPFAYPGKPGALQPDDATIHVLSWSDEDGAQALAALADELSVTTSVAVEMQRPEAATAGGISAEAVTQTWSRSCRKTASS